MLLQLCLKRQRTLFKHAILIDRSAEGNVHWVSYWCIHGILTWCKNPYYPCLVVLWASCMPHATCFAIDPLLGGAYWTDVINRSERERSKFFWFMKENLPFLIKFPPSNQGEFLLYCWFTDMNGFTSASSAQNHENGVIAEYPAHREHKLLAPVVPQWPKKVMQSSWLNNCEGYPSAALP